MTDQPDYGDVLVVDDTLANLRLLINLLSSQGYTVRPAQSGALALASVEVAQPDIILLDINMPNMDGFEVCEKLKANKETRDIPVIFISALNDTESKLRAFTSGGVDYVAKPFQLEEVSARIRTHLTINRLKHSLEERNRDLAAFDRSVAHDLRSPLTALLGMGELMTMDTSFRTDENFDLILESAKQMQAIVDALLLFAKVGAGDANIEPMDMGAIVTKVVSNLDPAIRERAAKVRVSPGPWPTALGYGPWVEQVLTNYATNGLKYGGTPVELLLGWDIASNGFPRFWVQDNGDGLSPDQIRVVFKEFQRLDNVKEEEGHGIGLSIVRRIVQKLGGEVGLESKQGYGSRFSFTLKPVDATRSVSSPSETALAS